MNVVVKRSIVAVLLLFCVYGFFFPRLPVVNADELWETSRGYYMKTMHKPGEPLLPESVAPFYSSIGNMGWKSWCILSVKTGTFAAMMYLLPVDELTAMRYGMFLWSLIACLFTFLVAKQFSLDKWHALLAIAILVAIPDFFAQIHRERSEIMICACLMMGVYFFNRLRNVEAGNRRVLGYFVLGILSWMPSLLIHPSAIVIPGVLGLCYLIFNWKTIFTAQTILFGVGLLLGAGFFLYIMNEMKEFAIAAGGGNYFLYQGPPMLVKGWKYVISIPYAFYNKFFVSNLISRPLSFAIFIGSFILIFLQLRNKIKIIASKENFILIGISIFLTLVILYLLSGSFGNFNVIVAPFVAIVLAMYIKNSVSNNWIQKRTTVLSILLLTVFTSNAISIRQDIIMANEYSRITSHVREKIDSHSTVLGLALYYNPFKDQPFYSNSWFNPYGGRIEQSFANAVKVLGVKYVIVDDAFVGRALLDRGNDWTNDMFAYLKSNGTVVDEIPAHYFVGNRVPDPSFYTADWKFPEQQKRYINKIQIIELK